MALEYFLKIDGVTGDVTSKLFAGWFAVDSFDLAARTPFDSRTGLPIGKMEFSPLTVDIHSLAGLAPLLNDEINNTNIKSVELEAIDTSTGKATKVYDLKISSARVASFDNRLGTNGGDTTLTFVYRNGQITDLSGVTTLWNTSPVTAAVVSSDSGSVGGTSSPAIPAIVVPTPGPLHYFLKINGVTGDVADKAHAGWFKVDGFDISAFSPFSAIM